MTSKGEPGVASIITRRYQSRSMIPDCREGSPTPTPCAQHFRGGPTRLDFQLLAASLVVLGLEGGALADRGFWGGRSGRNAHCRAWQTLRLPEARQMSLDYAVVLAALP